MLTLETIVNRVIEFINRILVIILEDAAARLLMASPVAQYVDDKRQLIESIDPNRFEAQQVASLLGIPIFIGTFLCRIAVRQGRFTKLSDEDSEGLYKLIGARND